MRNFILILSLLAFASLTSAVSRTKRSSLSKHNSEREKLPSLTNNVAVAFFTGFAVEYGENPQVVSDASACLDLGVKSLITTGAKQISYDTMASLLIGITELGQAGEAFLEAAEQCQVTLQNINDLQAGINSFANPNAFDYAGSSLWVDGFEIYQKIDGAREALKKNNDWEAFGGYIARAQLAIVLGPDAPLDDDMQEYINRKGSFKANAHGNFQDWTLSDLGSLVGTYIEDTPSIVNNFLLATEVDQSLPANFDSRTQWPNCVSSIRDQGYCGSCYAFAIASAAQDRLCINSSGLVNKTLSPQTIVSCDTAEFGCDGGYLSKAWNYVATSGLFSDSCSPYLAYEGLLPSTYVCGLGTVCSDASTPKLYYAKTSTTTKFTTVSTIQTNIKAYGPLTCTMTVYEDFFYYTSGIYTYTSGANYGGHAVRIVGWGKDTATNVNYWIIANSWGTSWGEAGYFRMAFGQVGIETNCWSARADLSR